MSRTQSNDFVTTPTQYPTQTESHRKEQERESATTGNEREGSRASSAWWPGYYPSWLPRRPSPPHPQSRMPSTAEVTDAEGGTVPSSEGRRPTPRSVRIISKPDVTSPEPAEATSSPRRRHEATDETEVDTPTPRGLLFPRSSITGTRPPRRPRFRSPGLRLETLKSPSISARLRYFFLPFLVFGHLVLQTFFDFNAIFVLIQAAKFPSPSSIVPASNHTWGLAAAAYIFCYVVQILGIFVLYEVVYSFYRRWRIKRPLIVPLYLSSPAHNFVSLTSYTNFCFFGYIRRSAFNPENVEEFGSWTDGVAEQCYFYAQNWPTIVTLLPRAALCLALLFTFSFSGGAEANGSAQRDTTFFRGSDGTLTNYAKGVLIANAVWTIWRTLVVLASLSGLWVFSGKACAGLCGPRFRWDEDEDRQERVQSLSLDIEVGYDQNFDSLGWGWRERTAARVRHAWEFCNTYRPRTEKGAADEKEAGEAPPTPSSSFPFAALDQILQAAGYPSPPTPARRRERVTASHLFESPPSPTSSPKQALSDIIPPPTAGKGKGKDAPLMSLPYPFAAFDTTRSVSPSGNVPFPSPVLPREEEDHDDIERDEDFEEDFEGDDDGDIEEELLGEIEIDEATPEEGEEEGRRESGSGSMSSLGQPLSSQSPAKYPFGYRRPKGVPHKASSSEEGGPLDQSLDHSVSSQSHSSGAIDPHLPQSSNRAVMRPVTVVVRPRADTAPSSAASRAASVSSRQRTRTISGVSGSRGEPQPEQEPVSMFDNDEEEDVEAAERDDSVGLLSPSVSPRSSLAAMRRRSLSLTARRSNGSRSASGSGESRSTSMSTNGSIRFRAQSLIQSVVPTAVRSRSRTRSSESVSAPRGRTSEETNDSGGSNNPEYTFGRPLPWARTSQDPVSPVSPTQEESDIQEASQAVARKTSVHSRGSSSGSPSNAPVRSEGEGDYTFGRPIPFLQRVPSGEEAASRPVSEAHPPASPSDPIPIPQTPTAPNRDEESSSQSPADISTAPASFVTARPSEVSSTSGGHSMAQSTFTVQQFHPDPTQSWPA